MFWKIRAENVRNVSELKAKIQSTPGVYIHHFGLETIFNSFHSIVVECDEKTVDKVRDQVYLFNNGAYCTVDPYEYPYEE